MKRTKKIFAVALAAMMMVSLVAALVACNNTVNVNWDNYILSVEEFAEKFNNKLPSEIIEVTSLPSYVQSVRTTYASDGLIIIEKNSPYVYGYLVQFGIVFGSDDNLVELYPDIQGVTFKGRTDSVEILYDIKGKEIERGYNLSTEVVERTRDNEKVKYLVLQGSTSNYSGNYTKYRKINDDGTLGNYWTAGDLPEYNDLPSVGEVVTKMTITLGQWLHIGTVSLTKEVGIDTILTDVTVQQMEHSVIFYKDGKPLSTLTMPTYVGSITYADGKLLYTTFTPVDTQASNGFNFVKDDVKYNAQMYSFDVVRGKTRKLSVNYVIDGNDSAVFYNHKKQAFDLVVTPAYRMIDGVAYANYTSQDMIVINNKGAIAYSSLDNPYGIPVVKIGQNYLTQGLSASMFNRTNIVNSKGKLVASLANVQIKAVRSDSLAVTVDGKLGTIDFNGIVKTPFVYNLESDIYGNYAPVSLDTNHSWDNSDIEVTAGETCIWEFETWIPKPLDYVVYSHSYSGNNFSVHGMFIREGDEYSEYCNWYLLDGTKVATRTTNRSLQVYTTTINEQTYGFAFYETIDGLTRYLKFVF